MAARGSRRRTPVAVCGACGAAGRPLQCLARGGELHNVCQVCFLAQEISVLASQLRPRDATLDLTIEGLTVLYQTIREEIRSTSDDAAEGRRSTEGQGERQGEGQS